MIAATNQKGIQKRPRIERGAEGATRSETLRHTD